MTSSDERFLIETAWRLDRLRWVPADVLGEIVTLKGLCLWADATGDPPKLTGCDTPDRELAARMCHQYPVQDECLELELRVAGEQTVGVWGALTEDDRRALYPHWQQRGERADYPRDGDGPEGERP